MAAITINIPDAVAPRVLNAICGRFGYSSLLDDGVTPNPETKSAFAKRMLVEHLIRWARGYEADQAAQGSAESARAAAEADFNANVTIS